MQPRISFLGCGSMAGSILSGYLGSGADPASITATVRTREKARELSAVLGIEALALDDDPEANQKAARHAETVVLGTKPYNIAALLQDVSASLHIGTLVISVAAATSLTFLSARLPAGQPVIRAIPNTPLKVRRGVVGITPGSHATKEHLDQARAIFQGAGLVLDIPEEQQDAVSAISGSGPAYAFYLVEAMAAAGRELGLNAELAEVLARETLAGAGALLMNEDIPARELRRRVTSPNGTTEKAIAVFEHEGFEEIVVDAAKAAAARAKVMAAENQGSTVG